MEEEKKKVEEAVEEEGESGLKVYLGRGTAGCKSPPAVPHPSLGSIQQRRLVETPPRHYKRHRLHASSAGRH